MPDLILVMIIFTGFTLSIASLAEQGKKTGITLAFISSLLLCWLTYYCFQPYRVREVQIKQISMIDHIQMITYERDGDYEIVNLNKLFGRMLKEHERIKIEVLDYGCYLGILPAREHKDRLTIIQPGDALNIRGK